MLCVRNTIVVLWSNDTMYKISWQYHGKMCKIVSAMVHFQFTSTMIKCPKYHNTPVPCSEHHGISTMVKCPKYHSK